MMRSWLLLLCANVLFIPLSVEAQTPVEAQASVEREAQVQSSEPSVWREQRMVLTAGPFAALHPSTGGARATSYGVGIEGQYWLIANVGVSLSYSFAATRRGLDEVHTHQLSHYLDLRVSGRALLSHVAALHLSVGPAMILSQSRHASNTNHLWAHYAQPGVGFGAGVDALAKGYGVRFAVDGWLAKGRLDWGLRVALMLPL